LPRNAEVAAIEVDDPFGLERRKIVTLRRSVTIRWRGCTRIVRSMRRNIRVGALSRAIGEG